MDQHNGPSGSASLQAPGHRDDLAGVGATSTAAAAAAAASTVHVNAPSSSSSSSSSSGPFVSGGVLDHRLAPRPRRSWDAAFLTNTGGNGTDTTGTSRPQPDRRMSTSAGAAGVGAGSGAGEGAGAGAGSRSGASGFGPITATQGLLHGGGDLAGMTKVDDAPYRRDGALPASGGGASFSWRGKSGAPGSSSASPDASPSPTPTSSRNGGAAASDDDLTDTDEGVLARLAEFTEIARRTAVHNEELSQGLATEKRRGAHTTRKLEQSNMTCTELRESLALAQDTVMKLREHEMAWAESTASEMSLRAEMCALKDEYADVSSDASVLRKRCDVLQRENTELGERFATIAEEKRQVESRARRLLRSDRYRGY